MNFSNANLEMWVFDMVAFVRLPNFSFGHREVSRKVHHSEQRNYDVEKSEKITKHDAEFWYNFVFSPSYFFPFTWYLVYVAMAVTGRRAFESTQGEFGPRETTRSPQALNRLKHLFHILMGSGNTKQFTYLIISVHS
jgi:hypothetical protein